MQRRVPFGVLLCHCYDIGNGDAMPRGHVRIFNWPGDECVFRPVC